jgi:hypothetical protein
MTPAVSAKKFWKTVHNEWRSVPSIYDPTPNFLLLCAARGYSVFVVLHTLQVVEDANSPAKTKRFETMYYKLLDMETRHTREM